MSNPAVFNVTVSANELVYGVSVDVTDPYDMAMDSTITLFEGDTYDGAYEFTPSAELQTVPTKNCTLTDDIIINPIPNNYGLIQYDGSTLTVS